MKMALIPAGRRQLCLVLVLLLLPTLISSLNEAQNPHHRSHDERIRAERSVDSQESNGKPFRFGRLDGFRNLTIQVGSTAYLHCPVVNLGQRELSWVRLRDWHILSHGDVMFITDERFQLVQNDQLNPKTDDWGDRAKSNLPRGTSGTRSSGKGDDGDSGFPPHFVAGGLGHVDDDRTAAPGSQEDVQDRILMVKHVEARDSGLYECQVVTDDGSIRSHRVDLKVETPEAFILADEEYHINRGSSLSLVCIIEKATEPPQFVFWYHNDRMINYDSERGISVTTTPGRKTHSQLSIQKAVVSDSGNYTCAPSSSLPASIQVFVSGSEVKPWTTTGSSHRHGGETALIILFQILTSIMEKLCSRY